MIRFHHHRTAVAVVAVVAFAFLLSWMLTDLLSAMYGLWAFATIGLWRLAWDAIGWLVPPGWLRSRVVCYLLGAASAVFCLVVLADVVASCYRHHGVCS